MKSFTKKGTGEAPVVIKQAIQDKAIEFIKGGNIEGLAKMLEEGSKESKFLNRLHTKTGKSSLMVAAEEGRPEAIVLMLDNFVNIEQTDKTGMTAFLYAAKSGETEIVELLAKGGADIMVMNEAQENAAYLVTRHGHGQTLKVIVELGVPFDTSNINQETPLMNSIKNENFPIAEYLLELKADINFLGKNGNSCLIRTAFDGRYDTAVFILEKGGNPNIKNVNGETALMIACKHNHDLIVDLLLSQAGILIDECDLQGKTSLMFSCMTQRLQVMKLLLTKGANVNLQDHWGYSALHYAVNSNVSGGHRIKSHIRQEKCNEMIEDMIDLLVAHSVWINVMDRCYQTPLMHACLKGNIEIAEKLLQRGANPNLTDINNKLAGDLIPAEVIPSPHVAATVIPASAAAAAAAAVTPAAVAGAVAAGTSAGSKVTQKPPQVKKETSQSDLSTTESSVVSGSTTTMNEVTVPPPVVAEPQKAVGEPITTVVPAAAAAAAAAAPSPPGGAVDTAIAEALSKVQETKKERYEKILEAHKQTHNGRYDKNGTVVVKPEWINTLNHVNVSTKHVEGTNNSEGLLPAPISVQ